MPEKNYLVLMSDFLDELLVVLVIYKMKIAESAAYHSLTQALMTIGSSTSLFVYDNSPYIQRPPNDSVWSIQYVHDASNPGVSKAYNEGFGFAKERNKKWLLLLDQDTTFPSHSVEEYFKAASSHPIVVPILKDRFGTVSPLRFYFGGGQRVKRSEGNAVMNLNDFLFHNSGLLVATETFERAGGYDEDLKLDFSDFAFVHRLRMHNKEFALANFYCSHGLATSEVKTRDERLTRFESYVSAGKYFKKTYAHSDQFLLTRFFLRGVKLCLQYRTHKFMLAIFRHT